MNDINNKVLAIMDLAMKISQNSKADIFVEYYAHINSLKICGHSVGWIENHTADLFCESMEYRATDLRLDKASWSFDESKIDNVLAELESIWEGICNGQAESES